MKWAIIGADSQTGREVEMTVDAWTAAAAEQVANVKGVYVSTVTPIRPAMQPRPVTPVTADYRSPQTAPAVPQYRLHAPAAVAGATFLGLPLAGSALMALNYHRLGKAGAAVGIIIAGLVMTILVVLVAIALPENMPATLLALPQLIGMKSLARSLQGEAIANHEKLGGRKASAGEAIGIGLAGLALYIATMLGAGVRFF